MAQATQELEQRVCQRFGWSARFFVIDHNEVIPKDTTQHDDGCWAVEVQMGLDTKKTFISEDRSKPTKDGIKQGKKAVASVALEGLQDDIQREMEKPTVSGLDEAVGSLFDNEKVKIMPSSESAWKEFWKNPPDAVGVDVEGNQVEPPVLVQIATDDMVILEAPSSRRGLSQNLKRLLSDDTIVKVFCDNGSHRDKKALGLTVPTDLSTGPIVDLENIASNHMGNVKVARGLAKLLCLVMPELEVRISKSKGTQRLKDVGKFTAIEQGRRPRLRGVHELTNKEQRYAALDAWCTLQIWRRLKETALE